MLGYFKKTPKIDLSENKKAEQKNDKPFMVIIAFFAVIIVFSVIRAAHDPVAAQQLKNLKISAFDVVTLSAAIAGYFITKKRRKK